MTENVSRKRLLSYTASFWIIVGIIFFAGISAYLKFGLPVNNIVANQAIKYLVRQGVDVKKLVINNFSQTGASIGELQIGESGASLQSADVMFAVEEIKRGYIREVKIQGLKLNADIKNDKIVVDGINLSEKPIDINSPPPLFDNSLITAVLPEHLSISGADITLNGGGFQLVAPLNVDFVSKPNPVVKLDAGKVKINSAPYEINLSPFKLPVTYTLSKKVWIGKVDFPEITVTGGKQEIPAISATGRFNLSENKFISNLKISVKGSPTIAYVTISVPLDNFAAGKIYVEKLSTKWSDGNISTGNFSLPFAMNKPVSLVLNLDKVDLSKILEETGGGKVKGTGRVSGKLPITYYPDGRIIVKDGVAAAIQNGVLQVSPDALPGGANAQLDLARSALQDFNYNNLRISVNLGADKKSTITMNLEGKSPAAFGERPIKLNINLNGDILPLIQQSILPMTDIRQFLKQQDVK